MANKTMNTRLKNKHGTEEYWTSHSTFVPLAGEIIIYDTDSTYSYSRIKVGNGSTTISNLPFSTEVTTQLSDSDINEVCT